MRKVSEMMGVGSVLGEASLFWSGCVSKGDCNDECDLSTGIEGLRDMHSLD